jgi:hypothetical protein
MFFTGTHLSDQQDRNQSLAMHSKYSGPAIVLSQVTEFAPSGKRKNVKFFEMFALQFFLASCRVKIASNGASNMRL